MQTMIYLRVERTVENVNSRNKYQPVLFDSSVVFHVLCYLYSRAQLSKISYKSMTTRGAFYTSRSTSNMLNRLLQRYSNICFGQCEGSEDEGGGNSKQQPTNWLPTASITSSIGQMAKCNTENQCMA